MSAQQCHTEDDVLWFGSDQHQLMRTDKTFQHQLTAAAHSVHSHCCRVIAGAPAPLELAEPAHSKFDIEDAAPTLHNCTPREHATINSCSVLTVFKHGVFAHLLYNISVVIMTIQKSYTHSMADEVNTNNYGLISVVKIHANFFTLKE